MLKVTQTKEDKIRQKYMELFNKEGDYSDLATLIEQSEEEYRDELRLLALEDMMVDICSDCYYYSDDLSGYLKNDIVKTVENVIDKLDNGSYYFDAFIDMIKGHRRKALKKIKTYINENTEEIWDTEDIANDFIVPFKNGIPGLWKYLCNKNENISFDRGALELCQAMEIFYKEPQKFDDVVDAFSKVLQVYPEDKVSREFLAECYAQNKLWHNAVAYYEQVEEPICIDLASWYFFMGWAYGKCKEHNREIECYRECIKVDGDYEFARNNLGYAYYQIGKYAEAEKIFLECIKHENNLSYACRNLFLTYIAEGKWDEIEKFEKISKFKMNKFIRDRYEKAKKRYCKTSVDTCFDESEEDCDDETTNKSLAGNNTIANSEQFSSEKILEDELTLRLESGQNIFGLDLKIYRRKGIYGRQFILPGDGRRLDLLAEDMSGNLYVIELKKDSGYDDAYEQTAAYIEWVERNMSLNGKHVYGIICLNNPLEILKRKIKKDKRIRLFEYQIAYTEIK